MDESHPTLKEIADAAEDSVNALSEVSQGALLYELAYRMSNMVEDRSKQYYEKATQGVMKMEASNRMVYNKVVEAINEATSTKAAQKR